MDTSLSSIFNKSTHSPRMHPSFSGRRSISGFKKSSRMSVSARSNQSAQVILRTQQHTVERFGQPLPVLVTETLTFADRNVSVSARISSDCGFAWIVCGRRLLIWQYRQSATYVQPGTPRRTGVTNLCYELQLPQSDLAHCAELISVFLSEGSNIPSCIAVSPEGVVRFWPNIAHEGTSIEQQIDLQGQECDSLTCIEGLGCILATTTCTIVLVQPLMSNGRNVLATKTLKLPSGWLGGISKRMSSLIFGPITDTTVETRIVRVRAVPAAEPNAWFVYVIAGHSLQKWRLSNTEPEQFIFAGDLSRLIRDGFCSAHWETFGGNQSELDVWIFDLQPDVVNNSLILLVGAVKHQVSPTVHLALFSIDPRKAPTNYASFTLLRLTGHYREDNLQECMNYRFITSGNAIYIFYSRGIHVFRGQDEDSLEFNSTQEFILCGAICINTPIFFSRSSGLMCVTNNDTDLNASVLSPGTPLESSICETGIENLTVYTFDPDEMATAYVDVKSQLKAAFIYYIKNQFDSCNEIVNSIISPDYIPKVDSNMDIIIVELSQELLDDIPANDPRWSNSQVGIGSSFAMQIQAQIEDKQKVHVLLVKFLKDADVWRKLGAISTEITPIATVYLIAEHREKIVAALALKTRIHNEIVQRAIEESVRDIQLDDESGLTKQSVFYRYLSKFENVIIELVKICENAAHSDMNPTEIVHLIQQTNEILLDVLSQVANYRQNNKDSFLPSPIALQLAPDYLPWTANIGKNGLIDSLILQQQLTYNYGVKCVSDQPFHSQLDEQLVSLIDFILDARKSHLLSIKGHVNENVLLKQYTTDRKKLIAPLVVDEKWEEAALLAEKYLDFESLVLICDKTDNQARLDKYIERFKNENFSQFVYNWYMQENKQGKLISLCKRYEGGDQTQHDLRAFLGSQPALSWIQNIHERKYNEAGDTLKKLADLETDSLTRQKTMYSIAKLAKFASDEAQNIDVIDHIDNRLELITYQEEIPDYVLQQYGYDTLKPRVIEPKELIHLYTCAEYTDATEVDFKKSLDLLQFISDKELKDELMLHIWKSAILKDAWDDKNLDSPLEALQNKLMFKIVDLAFELGSNVQTLLPPLNKLMNHPDLLELQNNRTFEYLLRAGYEQASKAFSQG